MHGSAAGDLYRRHFNRLAVCIFAVFATCCWSATGVAAEPAEKDKPPAEETTAPAEIAWIADYAEAMDAARQEKKMLLIYFDSPKDNLCRRFEKETLTDSKVREGLQDYVCVRLPVDTKIGSDGKEVELLKHASFREMLGRPGVAIIDFASESERLNGAVVSTFPLTQSLFYTPHRMSVILDLPPATLTQRTMIYAVRTHPERPASASGETEACLLDAAESHSKHQARIRLQGHHNWNSRFHCINASLPAGLTSCEVCAESWPGEGMVEAAVECVRCWRFSSGHWRAVRAFHPLYGYDMRCGRNGIWYATGIFGRR